MTDEFTAYDRKQDARASILEARLAQIEVRLNNAEASLDTHDDTLAGLEAVVEQLSPLKKLLWLVRWK